MYRTLLTHMHRYVGLVIALFLTLSGITGSVIAFHHELDEWLNPELYHIGRTAPALSASTLAARAEAQDARIIVTALPLNPEADEATTLRVSPRPGSGLTPQALGFNQLMVNPGNGRIISERTYGTCCFERGNIIGFLYNFHYTLAIPGIWGVLLMGGIAILWTVDCLVAFLLTLPRGTPFWRKWKPAWKIKTSAGIHRATYDSHRASGLWLWGILLIIAVSGVSLNLPDLVFRPVVSLFSPLTKSAREMSVERSKQARPVARVGFDEAVGKARQYAREQGWSDKPAMIFHVAPAGAYGIGFTPDGSEEATGMGASWQYIDDQTGQLLMTEVPGQGSAGDFFAQLQFPLHSGTIAGLTGRIVIAITGVCVAVLSITGIIIWWRKRGVRRRPRARDST